MKMKVTKLFYADLDQNLYNLFQNEIKVTYFNKSDSYINQIKAVVNIGDINIKPELLIL